MRTRDEIVNLLAKRKHNEMLEASTWGDLVMAIQSVGTGQRDLLVDMIKQNRAKEAGDFLYKALIDNVDSRSKQAIEAMLVNDSLSLSEIDELL